MRVLFTALDDFAAPSEKQILGFAQELLRRGHEVLVSISGDLATAETEGVREIDGLQIRRHRFTGPRLVAADRSAARTFAPDVIHAFASRGPALHAAREYRRVTGAPVVVHFGDDEWEVPGLPAGDRIRHRLGRLARRGLASVQPSLWNHSTRATLRWTRRHAAGLDALTPALAREVEARLGRSCAVVLPVTPALAGAEPTPPGARTGSRPTALFTGSLWPVYLDDVLIGMRAVAEVQRRGHALDYVHVGRVFDRFDLPAIARSAGLAEGTTRLVAYVPFSHIPRLLSEATLLLQPGAPTRFNRLRLPSKLQAYLASGTPTLTFAAGFGELLVDREEALLTHTGDALELADRIEEALVDLDLRGRLGRGGPAAAARLFDPEANTDALLAVYEGAIRDAGQSTSTR